MIFKPKCTRCASIAFVTNLCGPGAGHLKAFLTWVCEFWYLDN